MFELTPEYRDIQDRARALAAAVEPIADEADEYVEVHPKVRDLLADSGLARYVVPQAYGGVHDVLDPLVIAIVREALMYSSAHLDSMFGM